MTDSIVTLAVVLVITAVIGVWWSRRQGAVRPRYEETARDWLAHGVVVGPRATFVQLSAQVCAPCRATARVLTELATAQAGVTHRELDVDEHPVLVRDLVVLRTPTVLVLGPDGREVARMSGAVSRAQAAQALAAAEALTATDGRTRG